ncbi:hypothetical protein WDZ92_53520 [Nostoc sp. NIES-2111]
MQRFKVTPAAPVRESCRAGGECPSIDIGFARLAVCSRKPFALLWLILGISQMRFPIVNPDGPWIQGDIHAPDHAAAAASLEKKLAEPTSNDVWLVFEAPMDFPSAISGYRGTDPAILARLEDALHMEVRNGLLPEQPDLFSGPVP